MEGTSVARLLTARSDGGAGYVASELVEATIDGRSGTFVLQHGGIATLRRGVPFQFGMVVPWLGHRRTRRRSPEPPATSTPSDVARVTLDITL